MSIICECIKVDFTLERIISSVARIISSVTDQNWFGDCPMDNQLAITAIS